MSIRPRLGVEVPELTARAARASNPAGTTAMWVRDLTRLELVTEAVRGALEGRPHRRPGTGMPGGRRVGPPLGPSGSPRQEPRPAEDQDERRRDGRPPAT
jgi:hypothetical protein